MRFVTRPGVLIVGALGGPLAPGASSSPVETGDAFSAGATAAGAVGDGERSRLEVGRVPEGSG